MRLPPILSALLRNKTGLVLVALQIALTLAIVTNAVFLIVERVGDMSRPSGLDEANLFAVSSLPFAAGYDKKAGLDEDLQTLRSLPGVVDASSITSGLPLSGGGWSEGIGPQPLQEGVKDPASTSVAIYNVDEHGLAATGLNLVAGRNFTAEEIAYMDPDKGVDWPPNIILSQALATKLFPNGDALGKPVYMSEKTPLTIIGIVDRLQAPWVGWETMEQSALVPAKLASSEMQYVVRTQPGERQRVMAEVEAALLKANDGRIIRNVRDFDQIRARGYRRHRVTAVTLTVVIGALLAITALGIVGQASFWVTTRTKQIGTRRALGARKRDVLRYVQTENLLITGAGILAGSLLAFALNAFLMHRFDVPRLDWLYVPMGAVALLLLGQIAVFGPARRAAGIAPSVATRSV